MSKAKTAATNLPVPQSDAEAEQMIAQLGVLQRDREEAQTRHDATIALHEEAHGKVIKGFQDQEAGLVAGIEKWASAHRERLTNGGRTKTVQLASGSLSWREGRYAVKHRGLKNDDVVQAIHDRINALDEQIKDAKRRRQPREAADLTAKQDILQRFLRFKTEPNKDAMLADREVAETIRGVTVPRGPEEFSVEPLAGQISEVA